MVRLEEIPSIIEDALRRKGIDRSRMRQDEVALKDGCETAYKAIPWPLRWIIGRATVEATMQVIVRPDAEGITDVVYSAMPRPWRWFVGRRRVARLVEIAARQFDQVHPSLTDLVG